MDKNTDFQPKFAYKGHLACNLTIFNQQVFSQFRIDKIAVLREAKWLKCKKMMKNSHIGAVGGAFSQIYTPQSNTR